MGNDDAATDHEPHVERVDYLLVAPAYLDALQDMVVDAVVAAEHSRRYKTEQLLGLPRKRAVIVRHCIEVEEALDPQVVSGHDALVHLRAIVSEVVQSCMSVR